MFCVWQMHALSDVIILENSWTAADSTCLLLRLLSPGGNPDSVDRWRTSLIQRLQHVPTQLKSIMRHFCGTRMLYKENLLVFTYVLQLLHGYVFHTQVHWGRRFWRTF